MKKAKIVASVAASAALVALPAVGVFADSLETGPWTDTIDVTVSPTCTFTRDATTPHPATEGDGSGTWAAGTGQAIHTDTLAVSIAGDAINTNIGKSKFRVICNNHNGWNVKTTATALTGKTTSGETIPLGTVTKGTAAWNYTASTTDAPYVTVSESASTTSGVTIAQAGENKTTGNDGVAFTVQYGLSTSNAISAQVYEGSITYTFAEGAGAPTS